jgi:serine/threonine protein kinase/Tfp pilus assembly protein PilF
VGAIVDYQLASEIKARWEHGEAADARGALCAHPELGQSKAIALDLAYEAYRQRIARGEPLDVDEYCGQFSGIRSSLHRRLEVDQFLDCNSELLDRFLCDAWPEAGDEICGFRLLAELGRGAIGRVYLAAELALADRHVVVKLTQADSSEAETLSRLKHPHVMPIFSVHEDMLQGFTVVVMPFISRWTLQDLLDVAFTNGLAPERFAEALAALATASAADDAAALPAARERYVDGIVKLGVNLSNALAHTHSRDILHLDIKPSNVLLAPSGDPLLLDFNLSLAGAARSSLVGGTMPYMSPEQIRRIVLDAAADEVDGRSDVYALAIVLYQLLTGQYPFGRLSWRRGAQQVAQDLLQRQRAGPPPAQQHDPRVGRELSQILARALAWRPADRYQTAAEFSAALQQSLQARSRLRRWGEQHRREFLFVAGSAVATLGAVAAALLSRAPYAERELERGWQLLAGGEPRVALGVFHKLVVDNPELDEAWFGCGRAQQHLGEVTLAFQDFTEAHRRRQDGRYSACLGMCSSVRSEHAWAIAHYERAIEEGFSSAELYNNLGKSQRDNLGHNAQAVEPLRAALQIRPRMSIAWHNLGMVYQSLGDLPTALQCATAALAGDAPRVPMFVNKCMYLWFLKQSDYLDEIRATMTAGALVGMTISDCALLPIKAEALKVLPAQPQVPPLPTFALLDPLGDPAVTQAQRGRAAR